MVRVLIPTHLQDLHSLGIASALRLKGHDAVLWYGADFPTRQVSSLDISLEKSFSWEVKGPALNLADDRFDVVWYRRVTPAVLPDDMHPGDRTIAERECRSLTRALWQMLAPDAFWVNPLSSRELALSKPVQLLEAARLGLKIPPTLCSNDPEKIRSFLKIHNNGAIYKPFWPAQWEKGDEGIAVLFTSTVTTEDLPADDVLRLSPGIFQPKIEKEYELRVTYIGRHQFTAKLLSQDSAVSQLDWRAAFSNIRVEEAILPDEIDFACRTMMERFGIVFCCFDFIVTPQGDYVFLEINEMGQFLWIEEINPEFMLFDAFVEFLIHATPDFPWRPTPTGLRWLDFRDNSAHQHVQEDFPLHVLQPNNFAVKDQERPGQV
jgi:glutathione synthase/RimK-type ligase-like ATP-grasp enzyme